MPIPPHRIAFAAPIAQAQAQGQPGGGLTEPRAQPPGSERVEGAFGVFGMMITGLIIIFAVVILFLRFRRKR
jgi:uncharacterized membrane protein